GVLQTLPYSQFQVSDGVAGNALAEVNAQFPIDLNDIANVAESDIEIMSAAREVAESAEVDGFNPAIEAAGEDSEAGIALQNGKIKNKVLKLQLQVLQLMIKQANGDDVADKLAEQTTKLNKNVALDEEAAGQASQSVDFD
ncbi:hypothetical protein M501DRAFT_904804, partial [Patellaria atrata CBS 101060]